MMALLDTTPTPADLAFSGDLMAKLGQTDAAERQYRLAEAAWRSDAPEPSRLAWAYFQTGQIEKVTSMIALALRTGTRDATMRTHAAAIERATGNARQVARR